MNYQFAYSTNAYTKHTLAEAIDDVRRQGFDGVEILADTPHAFPGHFTDADLKALEHFPISNLNGNTAAGYGVEEDGHRPSLVEPDGDNRRKRIDYVKGVIDLARKIGAENVCTATGLQAPGQPDGHARNYLEQGLEEILAHASIEPQIRLGIEYEPGFFVGDLKTLLKILRRMNNPLLGANLDIGHSVCVGDDPAKAIHALKGRIWNMHLEDIQGTVHNHLIPGEGNLPFGKVRKALDDIGYDRFLTLELYPYKDNPGEAGKKGLAFLKPLFV